MLEQKISINNSPKICAMPLSKETKSASCCFCPSFAMSFFHVCNIKFVHTTIAASAPSVQDALGK